MRLCIIFFVVLFGDPITKTKQVGKMKTTHVDCVIDPGMGMNEACQQIQPHLSHYVMVGIIRSIQTEN